MKKNKKDNSQAESPNEVQDALSYKVLKPIDEPYTITKAKKTGEDVIASGYADALIANMEWVKVNEVEALNVEDFGPQNTVNLLYRQFAEIRTLEEILSFVNEYGEIGVGRRCELEESKSNKFLKLEFIHDWNSETGDMREILALWDVVKSDENKRQLDEMIEWKENKKDKSKGVGVYHIGKTNGEITSRELFLWTERDAYILKDFKLDDKEALARYRVQSMIDKKLRNHSMMRFVSEYPFKKPALSTTPSTLLGFLWTQFALEVLGKRLFLECAQCKKQYVDKLKSGMPKKTCSNACRIKLSRSKNVEV